MRPSHTLWTYVLLILLHALGSQAVGGRGSVLLVGGGSEDYNDWSDKPYRWLVEHSSNRRVAILHYSTTSSWLVSYFKWLGCTSDTTFAIPSVASANDSATYRAIIACNGVFLRGGDQWQYIALWKGTLVEQAIREVFQRGGAIGGTSAGMAVLSQVIFDARQTSVDPREALQDPLSAGITFTEGFLGFVPGILGDTHFFERGRLGRLLAMLAVYKVQSGKTIVGIGVDYNTALGVDSTGVGEVMGAGTVTVLRWRGETRVTLEPSKPLSISGMNIDLLTDGFRISLPDGAIQPPPSALAYSPKPFHRPAQTLFLDGSDKQADWLSATGSFTRFAGTLLPGVDTVGIICSPRLTTAAQVVASALTQRSIPWRQLTLNANSAGDALLAQWFSGCKGFVFAWNSLDSLAGYLDSSTATGRAFLGTLGSNTSLLYLGNDSRLIADTLVAGTETDLNAAYYGTMTLARGQGIVGAVEVMPRAYENIDSIDNRFNGLFWGLGKSRARFGFLIDEGTTISLKGEEAAVTGSTPAMIIDAQNVTMIDFPSFHRPGKANPRQGAALIGATIDVTRNGETFNLSDGTVLGVRESGAALPSLLHLDQNYPNPFNSSTRIGFTLPAGDRQPSSLRVFDVLGRLVTILVDGFLDGGAHEVRFDAKTLSSGFYVYRLQTGLSAQTKTMILLR